MSFNQQFWNYELVCYNICSKKKLVLLNKLLLSKNNLEIWKNQDLKIVESIQSKFWWKSGPPNDFSKCTRSRMFTVYFKKSLKITKNYEKFRKIAKNSEKSKQYQEFSKNSKQIWKIPKNSKILRKIPKNPKNSKKIPRN